VTGGYVIIFTVYCRQLILKA